ncbi:regulatory signaling modulator protein AmpE [Aliikangiella coralliicola]|uniref:Regulatory signaling modulator protein AmpE n=1 Tax=Aliikangiella coralliicola TaxID=2592383 RepID=A0A545U000_9GAMM|nr:regulatory signaling modulator protein AmpE [Aliikangiella coralliicola]TQV82784.1 regulatory signaling modulator protein AmpE [Aliikangiella coralliicola]
MTLLTVLLVVALEYHFQWGAEYRSFGWFSSLQEKLDDMFGEHSFFEGWGGIGLILLIPVLIVGLFVGIFDGGFYYLILFIVSCVVLFLCLGPRPLEVSFRSYFEAMERGDEQAAYLLLNQESQAEDVPEGDEIVRNATRVILVESQARYFGVLFWFIFLGPFGALFYRLAHQYYCDCKKHNKEEHLPLMSQLLHVVDWLPARLTCFLFLLTGDFVNGFYRVKDYFADLSANSQHIISETGVAALGLEMGVSDQGIKENRNAMAMVERTLIIYVVVAAALTPLAFW